MAIIALRRRPCCRRRARGRFLSVTFNWFELGSCESVDVTVSVCVCVRVPSAM